MQKLRSLIKSAYLIGQQLESETSSDFSNYNSMLDEIRELDFKVPMVQTDRDLVAANVALERFLNRESREDQFLVHTQDQPLETRKTHKVEIALDNIRSSFNVGSIFRSSEALGANHIYLAGYTSTPENEKTIKTTMGTDKFLDWSSLPRIDEEFIATKKLAGYSVFAMETAEPSQSIFNVAFPEKSLFIFGNERFGLEPSLLKLCDQVVHIPLLGCKNSLNVANAASMVLYEYNRQHV